MTWIVEQLSRRRLPVEGKQRKEFEWMNEKTSKTSLVTPINNKRRETNLRANPSIAACDNMGEFYKNKPPASQKSPWWQLVRIHIHPLSAKPHPNPIRQKKFWSPPSSLLQVGQSIVLRGVNPISPGSQQQQISSASSPLHPEAECGGGGWPAKGMLLQ